MIRAIAVAALTLTMSGCSLIGVKGPPQWTAGQVRPANVTCTTSETLPKVDLVIGIAGSLAAAADQAAGAENPDYTIAVNVAALVGFAGLYGAHKVRRCQRFMAETRAPRSQARSTRAPADISWWPQEWKGRPMIPTR